MSKEIVIVMGYNAAGKSTFVKRYVDKGYVRINRDTTGGSIDRQADLAVTWMQKAETGVVLDNTYPTVASRQSIVTAGKKLGVPVVCVWLTTSFEDAQFNACMRMMERCGHILGPEEFKTTKDPNLFPPAPLFKYKKEFQEPTTKEGFAKIEAVPFVRTWDAKFVNEAIILDYDGTLRESTGAHPWPEDPSEVKILPNRVDTLTLAKAHYKLLLGASTQSACAKGLSLETARQCFYRTNELLGADIEYLFCPHASPPKCFCYCRKPAPGLGVTHIWNHHLLPSKCIMVGDKTEDKTFAARCGFQFQTAEEFFAPLKWAEFTSKYRDDWKGPKR